MIPFLLTRSRFSGALASTHATTAHQRRTGNTSATHARFAAEVAMRRRFSTFASRYRDFPTRTGSTPVHLKTPSKYEPSPLSVPQCHFIYITATQKLPTCLHYPLQRDSQNAGYRSPCSERYANSSASTACGCRPAPNTETMRRAEVSRAQKWRSDSLAAQTPAGVSIGGVP